MGKKSVPAEAGKPKAPQPGQELHRRPPPHEMLTHIPKKGNSKGPFVRE